MSDLAIYEVPIYFEEPPASALIVKVLAANIVDAIDFATDHTPGWFHVGAVTRITTEAAK